MEVSKENFIQPFDLVFCRNVFIYFTVREIESISRNILKNMEPYGQFFIGVSESLLGAKLPVEHLGKSIYAKSDVETVVSIRPNASKDRPALKDSTSSPEKNKDSGERRLTFKERRALKEAKKERESARDSKVKLGKVVPSKDTSSTGTSKGDDIKVITLQSTVRISPNIRSILNDLPGYKSVGFDVVSSPNEAVTRIKKKEADLLILDVGAAHFLSKIQDAHPIPTIIVAPTPEDESKAARAMEDGASDYVKGDFKSPSDRDKQILELKLHQASKDLNEPEENTLKKCSSDQEPRF